MTASIRSASPDDSEFLAWAILSASRSHGDRGTFDLMATGSEQDRLDLIEWMVLSEVPSYCRFDHFHVYLSEHEPVGVMAGYDPGEAGLSSLATTMADAFEGLGFEAESFPSALERLEAYRSCAVPLEPGTWVIEWVATRPDHRGRGIAAALLEHVLEVGRTRGHEHASVATMIGNDAAIRVYQRAGFEIAEERRHDLFEQALGSPGMVRLIRTL